MLRQCGDTTVAAMQYTQLAGKAQQRVTSCSGSVATQQWQFDAVIDSKSNNKNPLTVSGHVCTLKKLSQVCTGQGRFPHGQWSCLHTEKTKSSLHRTRKISRERWTTEEAKGATRKP